jgi:hypothetical protein
MVYGGFSYSVGGTHEEIPQLFWQLLQHFLAQLRLKKPSKC